MKKTIVLILVGILFGSSTTFAALEFSSDIAPNSWYANDAYQMQINGIMKGYEDKTFRPENNVNRAELAATMNRMLVYMEQKFDERINAKIAKSIATLNWKSFSDNLSMSMKYPENWIHKEEIANGAVAHNFSLGGGTFSILPQGEFDVGLPAGEPESNGILMGGKKTGIRTWKTTANTIIGIVKIEDSLPFGWTENHRIQFTVPQSKWLEVSNVLDSIEFYPEKK